MERDELLTTLEALHAELSNVDRVDPQTRDALARVTGELKRLVDPDDATTADDIDASSEGLRGYLLEFEAEHPRLAETLGRLADGLANLGI